MLTLIKAAGTLHRLRGFPAVTAEVRLEQIADTLPKAILVIIDFIYLKLGVKALDAGLM